MKYLSLFSGIGGFEKGIQNAFRDGVSSKQTRGSNLMASNGASHDTKNHGPIPECIGYSEIDKYAVQIYEKHFPEHKNYGDITKLDTRTLERYELLVGGFPCQSFSIAGKRRGFEDTRGTMFFFIANILAQTKPRLLLLENVKGLLSHDKGETFRVILKTLDELGYDLQWQVLNSKNFGVPQNRERVFIIGHLRGTRRPQVFPIGENSGSDIVLPTLTARYYGGQANGGYIGNKPKKTEPSRQTNGQDKKQSNDSDGRGGQTYPSNIRRLTPTECCRLQGFPDDWVDGISDSQKYKCLGNAVTVNVIQAIMERLITT